MDGPKQKQLEAMYEREAKNIYKYLYHLCQNKETAEDLTAETFLKAAKSLSGFRGECRESVWLCQIAKHLWFRELKRQKRMEALPEDRETASDQDVEAQVLASLGRLEWFQKMQGLEPVAREVMYLRLYGDLSFKESGEVLGRTENWDSQMPMTMHAATDQVRYAWLYWLVNIPGYR